MVLNKNGGFHPVEVLDSMEYSTIIKKIVKPQVTLYDKSIKFLISRGVYNISYMVSKKTARRLNIYDSLDIKPYFDMVTAIRRIVWYYENKSWVDKMWYGKK